MKKILIAALISAMAAAAIPGGAAFAKHGADDPAGAEAKDLAPIPAPTPAPPRKREGLSASN